MTMLLLAGGAVLLAALVLIPIIWANPIGLRRADSGVRYRVGWILLAVLATWEGAWLIDHNLGFMPSLTVVDSAGTEVFPGTVEYLTTSTIRLTFSAAFGGEAYLS